MCVLEETDVMDNYRNRVLCWMFVHFKYNEANGNMREVCGFNDGLQLNTLRTAL